MNKTDGWCRRAINSCGEDLSWCSTCSIRSRAIANTNRADQPQQFRVMAKDADSESSSYKTAASASKSAAAAVTPPIDDVNKSIDNTDTDADADELAHEVSNAIFCIFIDWIMHIYHHFITTQNKHTKITKSEENLTVSSPPSPSAALKECATTSSPGRESCFLLSMSIHFICCICSKFNEKIIKIFNLCLFNPVIQIDCPINANINT